jgi:GNAT superfamily N-acetyltransferase
MNAAVLQIQAPSEPDASLLPDRFEKRYSACIDARGHSLPTASVVVERADLRRPGIDALLADMLQHEADEGWNPRSFDHVAWLWETRQPSGEPIGFATLKIDFDEAPRGRVAYVLFGVGLVWIHPARRGRRYGARFAGAVGDWLAACHAYGPRVAAHGLRVDVVADLYSEGGDTFTKRVYDHFVGLQRSLAAGTPAPTLGWAVREARDRRQWHWPLP